MDLLRRLFGFDELLQIRTEQLRKQAEQDKVLRETAKRCCPAAVANYLLEERLRNRNMTYDYGALPLSQYYMSAKLQLKCIEERQHALDEAIRAGAVCDYLRSLPSADPSI